MTYDWGNLGPDLLPIAWAVQMKLTHNVLIKS